MSCFVSLLEDYSRCNITKVSDRPIAISGLENRMSKALFCESRFCTFERFFHRSLLWEATTGSAKIDYKDPVPSWSWLLYSGGIGIYEGEYRGIFYELNCNISFNPNHTNVIGADLGVLCGCELELEDERCILQSATEGPMGLVRFDVKGPKNLDNLHCVVVAATKFPGIPEIRSVLGDGNLEFYVILAVVPTGYHDEFKRVGIGSAPSHWLIKVQDKIRLV